MGWMKPGDTIPAPTYGGERARPVLSWLHVGIELGANRTWG